MAEANIKIQQQGSDSISKQKFNENFYLLGTRDHEVESTGGREKKLPSWIAATFPFGSIAFEL